jgi:ATP-dependent RNA helicase A
MNPEDAAKLVALRPCIESLIIRATTEPSILENKSELDKELEALIRQLCGENAWRGTKAQIHQPPVPYSEYQQRNRAKHHHHYQGQQRNQLPQLERPVQYPDQRSSGFNRGGYRGNFRGSERPVYSANYGGFHSNFNRGSRYGAPPHQFDNPNHIPIRPNHPTRPSPFHVKNQRFEGPVPKKSRDDQGSRFVK